MTKAQNDMPDFTTDAQAQKIIQQELQKHDQQQVEKDNSNGDDESNDENQSGS